MHPRKLKKYIFSLLFAVCLSLLFPKDAISGATPEIIAFFGIQSAAVMPAMVFSAGVLRAEGLTLSDLKIYYRALKSHMMFCVSLLVFDYLTVASVIFGTITDWTLIIGIPWIYCVDIGKIFIFSFYLFGCLSVIMTLQFVFGFLGLLDLKKDIVQKSILRREEDEFESKFGNGRIELDNIPNRYGEKYSKE